MSFPLFSCLRLDSKGVYLIYFVLENLVDTSMTLEQGLTFEIFGHDHNLEMRLRTFGYSVFVTLVQNAKIRWFEIISEFLFNDQLNRTF